MNKHIEKLPKQYRESIRDFYKDDDGWWICLDEQGVYYFDGYASQYCDKNNYHSAGCYKMKGVFEKQILERFKYELEEVTSCLEKEQFTPNKKYQT